jgi:hypothetical protein
VGFKHGEREKMKTILISTGQEVYPLHYAGQQQYWPINFWRVLIPTQNGKARIQYIRKNRLRQIKTNAGK